MFDLFLSWFVVAAPFFATLIFAFLPERNEKPSTHRKWRIGFILTAVAYSLVVLWQQTRQQAETDKETRRIREQMVQQEQASIAKFESLSANVSRLLARQPRLSSAPRIVMPAVPTAEEIAEALEKRQRSAPYPVASPTPAFAALPTPTPALSSVAKPCRGDHLEECSPEQFMDWVNPLLSDVETVENTYMTNLHALDDIKSGPWFKEVLGIDNHDSRWLKAYALAQETAAGRLRDCCADRSLAYLTEAYKRTGDAQSTELTDWLRNLLKPKKSKEWKTARDDAGKVISLLHDLRIAQINVRIAQIKRR